MTEQNLRAVTITGGTGYVGRPLIEQLVARGNRVTALARSTSRSRVPTGAKVVEGSALKADDVAAAISPGCTLVLLVGTPHPSPSKARQFQEVDLASVRAAAEAALIPFYWLFEQMPSKRDTALRLGLVTHEQMVGALARAIANPPASGVRMVEVPEIRKGI